MMKSMVKRLGRDTRGANMVEYIILVGVVALLAIVAFKAFNTSVQSKIKAQGAAVETITSTGQ
jgi:Flp pilus assembly pilin Flp